MTDAGPTLLGAAGRACRPLVLAAAAALSLAGCASIQQAFSGWFGPETESSATPAAVPTVQAAATQPAPERFEPY